jgi:hypothetical protein
MDNGNGGPGNRVAQNFEQSMSEAPVFNPEMLPTPDDKENDPGLGREAAQDNLNLTNDNPLIDPTLLGASAVQAMQYGAVDAGVGEVVDEGEIGRKALTEEQIQGGANTLMFQEKGGVSKETEERLDNLKKKSDLYEMSVSLIEEQKKALATNFQDRRGLMEGRK